VTELSRGFSVVPADARPEEVERLLGPAPANPAPSADQRERWERWGSAATELLRINLIFLIDGERRLWNAAHVEDGLCAQELSAARLLSPELAEQLSRSLLGFLTAAEALRPEILCELRTEDDRISLALYHREGALPAEATRLELGALATSDWPGREVLAAAQEERIEAAAEQLRVAWRGVSAELGAELTIQTFPATAEAATAPSRR